MIVTQCHTPIGNLGKMFYCTHILHHLDYNYNHVLSKANQFFTEFSQAAPSLRLETVGLQCNATLSDFVMFVDCFIWDANLWKHDKLIKRFLSLGHEHFFGPCDIAGSGRLDCLWVFKVISHNAALSACEKGTGAIGVCAHAQERDDNQIYKILKIYVSCTMYNSCI